MFPQQRMQQKLINYFSKITPLSAEEAETITSSMTVKTYRKGDIVLREGQYSNDTYFVLEGCIRQYKVIDGNEITTNFFTEEQWIISFDTVENKSPSKYYLVCVEDTSVVVGNEQKSQEIFKQFPNLEKISLKIMETVFMEYQSYMTNYITDKPEQRYLKLLQSRPDIFQRVPQYDIASYIGVKPESLSRIRKKLVKKN